MSDDKKTILQVAKGSIDPGKKHPWHIKYLGNLIAIILMFIFLALVVGAAIGAWKMLVWLFHI